MGCRSVFRLIGRKRVVIFWFFLPQCEVVPEHHQQVMSASCSTPSPLHKITTGSWSVLLKFPSCSFTHRTIQEYLKSLSAILTLSATRWRIEVYPSFKRNKQAEVRMYICKKWTQNIHISPLMLSYSHYTSIVAYLFVLPVYVDIICGVVSHVPNIFLNNTGAQIHHLLYRMHPSNCFCRHISWFSWAKWVESSSVLCGFSLLQNKGFSPRLLYTWM